MDELTLQCCIIQSIKQAISQSISQPLLYSFILAEKVSKFNKIINSRVGVVALIGQILPNVTVSVAWHTKMTLPIQLK